MPQRWSGAAAALGFLGPVGLYLWFIGHNGVNSVHGDEWSDVALASRAFGGTMHLSELWGQWSVERMFFPRLVVLGLAYTTHLNTVVEMYLGAASLFGATALVVAAHRRRAPGSGWLAYVPVAFVMLSLVQYEDTLWGFQLAWYMILLALAAAIWFLDSERLSWPVFVAAVAVSVMASYSSFQGLLIWPVGVVLLVARRRGRQWLVTWTAAAIITIVGYFAGFHDSEPGALGGLHHPLVALWSFFSAVGDVVGVSTPILGRGNPGVTALGILIVACTALLVLAAARHEGSRDAVGISLVVFGLLWAAAIATSQPAHIYEAFQSRFRLYTLLVLAGDYLLVLSLLRHRRETAPRASTALVTWGVVAVLSLVVVAGTVNGLRGGKSTRTARLQEAAVTANEPTVGRDEALVVDPLFGPLLYREAPVARRNTLSFFATGAGADYVRAGVGGGLWAGDTIPHALPWRDIPVGAIVHVHGGGLAPDTRHRYSLMQCTSPVVYWGAPGASCATDAALAVSSNGSGAIDADYRMRLETGRPGACTPGGPCYLVVMSLKDLGVVASAQVVTRG